MTLAVAADPARPSPPGSGGCARCSARPSAVDGRRPRHPGRRRARHARAQRLGQDHADPDAARPDPPHDGHGRAARPPDADAAAAVLPHVGALVEGPGFHPFLSGRENLRRVAATEPLLPTRAIPAAVDAALDRVGLGHAADRRFRGYSLGMKQRLGLGGGAAAAAPPGRPRRADERPRPRRHPRRPRDHRRAARGRRDGRRVVAPAHRGRGHLHARRRAPVGLADRRGRAAPRCSTPDATGLVVATPDADLAVRDAARGRCRTRTATTPTSPRSSSPTGDRAGGDRAAGPGRGGGARGPAQPAAAGGAVRAADGGGHVSAESGVVSALRHGFLRRAADRTAAPRCSAPRSAGCCAARARS